MADAAVLQEMHGDPELCVSRKDASYYTGLLAAGNQILVAKLGGSIVFYAVITFKYTRLWTRYFLHRADEFYISRCFTKTSYRGRGIYPQAIRHICTTLAGQGYCTGYLGVATQNDASTRGVIKAGAECTNCSYFRIRVPGFDAIVPRGNLSNRFVSANRLKRLMIEGRGLCLATNGCAATGSAKKISVLFLIDQLWGTEGGTEQHLLFLLGRLPREEFRCSFCRTRPSSAVRHGEAPRSADGRHGRLPHGSMASCTYHT